MTTTFLSNAELLAKQDSLTKALGAMVSNGLKLTDPSVVNVSEQLDEVVVEMQRRRIACQMY